MIMKTFGVFLYNFIEVLHYCDKVLQKYVSFGIMVDEHTYAEINSIHKGGTTL